MVRWFVEVCRRRGLKVNVGKSKVMVMNGGNRLECEVYVDGIRLEHVLEFKNLGCVLYKPGTDEAECTRRVVSRSRVTGAIRPLVNARDLQLDCARVLYEKLFVSVLMYSSATMSWREEERSRIRAVQMDNLRGLLGIRRLDIVPNAWIRELFRVMNGVDERIEGVCSPVVWAGGEDGECALSG